MTVPPSIEYKIFTCTAAESHRGQFQENLSSWPMIVTVSYIEINDVMNLIFLL